MNKDNLIEKVISQQKYIMEKYGCYASFHEAMSIFREEFEELWEECKKKELDYDAIESEIIDCMVVLEKMYVDIVLKNKK